MTVRTKNYVAAAVGLIVVALVALGGRQLIVARAAGIGAQQSPAAVKLPPLKGSSEPQYERWMVGRASKPITLYRRAGVDSPVLAQLQKVNQNGYPTIVLVDSTRVVGDRVWYRVWVAKSPNGTRGWVREGNLAFYTTSTKIVIDLSQRKLSVYCRGQLKASYSVAVGKPGLATPTGFFFVNQKLRPATSGGPYGVLALGISAFQPKLSYWAQDGPVAIHGTNQDQLIGKAVSHGCVRMHNKDVLAVSKLVPVGSPVVIVQ